ncbi:MAG: hypothetical protein JWM33_1950 [Caulobacteraceae bacterium]|nr:hypothetical protein [Caulobacteraceae bacterium]
MTAPLTAKTLDGLTLPVIDVTDPQFHAADDPETLARLDHDYVAAYRQQRGVPRFLQRFFMRQAAKSSPILRALIFPDQSFLPGLSTYLVKLPADLLPPAYGSPIDRRLVESAPCRAVRIRMTQVARLLAEALEPVLEARPGAPLRLFNIAGGPSLDSLNALILLRGNRPDLLAGRQIEIEVLDGDSHGPAFGANALAALSGENQVLAGLDIALRWEAYDWNVPARLSELTALARAQGAILAVSSEGGLFEYGGNAAVIGNLRALGDAPVVVAGSVTRNDLRRRRYHANLGLQLKPRGLEGFVPLAEQAGYRLERSLPLPLSDQVALVPG